MCLSLFINIHNLVVPMVFVIHTDNSYLMNMHKSTCSTSISKTTLFLHAVWLSNSYGELSKLVAWGMWHLEEFGSTNKVLCAFCRAWATVLLRTTPIEWLSTLVCALNHLESNHMDGHVRHKKIEFCNSRLLLVYMYMH